MREIGGWSILSVWGDFEGGDLEVQGVGVINPREKHIILDGLVPHRVGGIRPRGGLTPVCRGGVQA